MISHVCEDCGRTFDREEYLTVHPCPAVIGTVKARAIRSRFDPGQYRLDEFGEPVSQC
jgi:predicted RNA-binding Zn-ribbon protein involved in translation (DUF1610 family)